ncbi:MAG: hypothetical protein QW035_04550 [Candidatus Anstonellales archaeon]
MKLDFTKEQITQILVFGIVLIFVLEIFAMSLSGRGGQADNNSGVSGQVVSNFRVLSYAPYIKVSLEGFNKSDIMSISHVDLKFSRPVESEGIYLIAVDDGANVMYVYKELLAKGYSGSTELRAYIYNATFVETNESFPSASFSFTGEPIYLLDVVYRSTFIGSVNGSSQMVSQFAVIPEDQNLTMQLNWTLQKSRYLYAIPWEHRNGYGNISNYSEFGTLQKRNYFLSNISKAAPYVTSTIGDKRLVLANFTDKEAVLADFPDAVFPDSELKADYELDLPFNYTFEHIYYAFLPAADEKYYYGEKRVFYTSIQNLTGNESTLLSVKLNGIKALSVQVLSVSG